VLRKLIYCVNSVAENEMIDPPQAAGI